MLKGSSCPSWSCHRLEVRLNDSVNAADLREAPQFVQVALSGSHELSEGLECYVLTNLVSVLEAVGHRLRRAVDAHGHALDLLLFHTTFEGRTGETHDPDGGRIPG